METGSRSIPGTHGAASAMFRNGILKFLSRTLLIATASIFMAPQIWPQESASDLGAKSIEDLMNIEVTSVSKTTQKISRTASAIFVISQDDIRRSNATNIPDLLRMVPGVDVAQIDSNTWAISVRGLNGRFSNELLVLLDGRSVYTPTFDGVNWDVLDLPLEDIERIEVIRGPGASVWASNAVNGVINIITKKASGTSGGMIVAGGGSIDQGFGTAQYGADIGKNTAYRVYTKYFNQDHFPDDRGEQGGDGWHLASAGFRTDSVLSSHDSLTLEGSLYAGREGNPDFEVTSLILPPVLTYRQVNLGGGFVQTVWDHTTSSTSGTSLQLSYDNYERNDVLGETRGTLDVAFQNHFAWGQRQKLVWGVEYRYSMSHTVGSLTVSLDPPNRNTSLFSSFVQDEIALVPDRLFVTVGTKVERDVYSGWNAQPSAQVAWTPTARRTFWAAFADVYRTPAAIDASIVNNLGGFTGPEGPVAFRLLGSSAYGNERTITYEAGYRMSVAEKLSLDANAYYNTYSHQETYEPGVPFLEFTPAPPHLVMPLFSANLLHGESTGSEIAMNWKPASRWMLSPGYAFQEIHLHLAPQSHDTTSVGVGEGSSPVHSAQLRSHLELPRNLSWDISIYFVGRLADPVIPSYTRLDTGLTWHWNERSSFSLVGQNLLKDRHEEYVDSTGSAATTLIKRSVYAQFRWQF
jgi:iron complex outermembrane recepter protein